MSASHMDAWNWWHAPENKPDIIMQPHCGGGLAAYRDADGEIHILQHDFHQDDNPTVIISPHLIRPLIEKLCELLPELVEKPAEPLVIQPARQLAIAGPRRKPVNVPLPLMAAGTAD